MLGFILTSTFFIFSVRQRTSITTQRETSEILNARYFAESYADYLEKNPSELTDSNFDILSTDLTKQVTQIVDLVDAGNGKAYEFEDEIFIEWNLCEGGTELTKGDILINDVIYNHSDGCSGTYSDVAGPITITDQPDPTPNLKIETLNEPFQFRINGVALVDNKWHLDVTADLDYGRSVKIERTFPATP